MNESKTTAKSNVEWERWAEVDPLYGVSSLDGRNKSGSNPWTDPDFYAHGQKTWAVDRARWETYGLTYDSCLEIGCGAGRVTAQLVQDFRKVFAVDVAAAMIEKARNAAPSATYFHTTGTTIPLPDSSVSAVFSCDVFQHFSSREICASYFREMFRVLRPGGTVMIHMPVYVFPRDVPPVFLSSAYKALRFFYEAYYNLRRVAVRYKVPRFGAPFMLTTQYERAWVFQVLESAGYTGVEIRYPNYRSWVLARRPSQ